MTLALKEARKAYKDDEVPVGCVIVLNDEVIAKAHNKKMSKQDPTSHAEMEAIKKACKKIDSKYLNDAEMYVTLEPCIMCAGAIMHSRIKKLYIGTTDPKGGAYGSCIDMCSIKWLNHYPIVKIGLLQKECSEILKEFFKEKRKNKKC